MNADSLSFIPPNMTRNQETAVHASQTMAPFTIAVLPDTQFYCDTRLKLSSKWGHGDLRHYFFEQTRWILENRERLNIAFVVHEGDIVQADAPEEWAIAKEAMSVLDGKVPYCMCLGDHDMGFRRTDANPYGGEKAFNRNTQFRNYFPLESFAKRRELGGTFEPGRHDNSWYEFVAAGMTFLIISLEFHPRDEVGILFLGEDDHIFLKSPYTLSHVEGYALGSLQVNQLKINIVYRNLVHYLRIS